MTFKHSFLAIGLCTLLAFVVVVAQPSTAQEPEDNPDDNGAVGNVKAAEALAVEVDTLNISSREPATLDPALATNSPSIQMINQLFAGLTRFDDITGQTIPDLASSWDMTPDGKIFTFTLRGGLTWSDGTALTAEHVRYGILRSLDPATDSDYAYVLYLIKNAEDYKNGSITDPDLVGITVLDNTHIRFELEEPAVHFTSITSMWVARPIPEWAINAWGDNWTDAEHIVTNGPYLLDERVDGSHILLKKNSEFYNAANVNIEKTHIHIVDEENEEWNMYQAGELDTLVIAYERLDEVRSDPILSQQLHTQPLDCTYYYGFSTSQPPFDNDLVRKAFSAATDRQGLINDVTGGIQQPALTFTPPGIFGHVDGYTEGVGYAHNATHASQWLADAGYPDGQGLPPITLWHNESDGHAAIAEFVVQSWEDALGVTVERRDMPWNDYLSFIDSGEAQIWRMGWCSDYNDAYNFLHDGISTLQHNGWTNAAYEDLLTQAIVTSDLAARGDLYKQAEEILVEADAVMIPLYFFARAVLTQPYLQRTYGLSQEYYLADWQITRVTATIDTNGGNLESYADDLTLIIPPDTFADTVQLIHSPTYGMPAPNGLTHIGQVFELVAIYESSGEPAQPQPGHSYNLSVEYAESIPALEDTLDFYYWDGNRWILESTSTRHPDTNTITAMPNHFSTWAVMGEPGPESEWMTIMSEDFEGVFPNGDWEICCEGDPGADYRWGKDDFRSDTGVYAAWPAAAGLDAIDPASSNYPSNMDTWMQYGPFDLSDALDATLEFRIRTDITNGDQLRVAASGDTDVWSGPAPIQGSMDWNLQSINLASLGFLGDDSVWIHFRFLSDGSDEDEGPWVDNIVLQKLVDSPPSFDCSTVTEIPESECEILVTLYSDTGGPDWSDNSGWLQTDTPCSWYGVQCSTGHVFALELHANQLSGIIPAQVGDLSNLESLNLKQNTLIGRIPANLGNLDNLEELYLYDNQLSGSIPVELGDIPLLQKLNLSQNQLSGSIPADLGNLDNLQLLSLHSNQLNDTIPSQLGNLQNLQTLYLSNNQLSGSIPVGLGTLPNILALSLANNDLTGTLPPHLGGLLTLKWLYLSGNQLENSIPIEFFDLENLLVLDLANNKLSGVIPDQLDQLSSLEVLTLNDNGLSGNIPSTLLNLEHLIEINLKNNELIGAIPTGWVNLGSLSKLNLGGNYLIGVIPTDLGELSSLQQLSLTRNQLTGSIPHQLGNLANLQTLYLSNNQLSNCIPLELGQLSNLLALSVASNALSCYIPPELCDLSTLKWLYLSDNQLVSDSSLDDGINPCFGNLPNLLAFSVDKNPLNGSLPEELQDLAMLESYWFDNTTLCEPGEPTFQTWLNSIPDLQRTGISCGNPTGITVDEVDCTLLEAIETANAGATDLGNGCGMGNIGLDTIILTVDVKLTTVNTAYEGDTGLPVINSSIIIEGNDHAIERDANAADFRILAINDSGNLTLNNVTVRGANLQTPPNFGGGIYNKGSLSLNYSTIENNIAGNGGGINNYRGELSIHNSTISNNSSVGHGGGIWNGPDGTVLVNGSTLSNNNASLFSGLGGGIDNLGQLEVRNSTLSNNYAYYSGGGIEAEEGSATIINSTVSSNAVDWKCGGISAYSASTLTVRASTVFGNSVQNTGGHGAPVGGGLCISGEATLTRSLITGNNAPARQEISSASSASIVSDNNLIGHSGETASEAFGDFTPSSTDIVATSNGTDTLLQDIIDTILADNGGPTRTHALVANSPAIDASPASEVFDQRGVPRPISTTYDIGAAEYVPSDFQGTPSSDTQVELSWNNIDVDSYIIWHSNAPYENHSFLENVGAALSYPVTTTSGQKGFYELRGVNGGVEGFLSGRLGVFTFGLTPAN